MILLIVGEIPAREGKRACGIDGYVKICESILSYKSDFRLASACHAIICLQWNLMQRMTDVVTLHSKHVTMVGDAISFRLYDIKNDKTGALVHDRHVYATPTRPSTCPFLSLAIFIFSDDTDYSTIHNNMEEDGQDVLVFNINNEAYSRVVKSAFQKNSSYFNSIGINSANELASHSLRKGGVTFLLGIINGCLQSHVDDRAGWKKDNIMRRYDEGTKFVEIFFFMYNCRSGDMLVGKLIGGVNHCDRDHAMLCPHFSAENIVKYLSNQVLDRITPSRYLSYFIIFFNLRGFSDSWYSVYPFLIASLIYHESYLKSTLPKDHKLFYSKFWYDYKLRSELSNCVETGFFENKVTGLCGSGINPNLKLFVDLADIKARLEAMDTRFLTGLDTLKADIIKILKENPSIVATQVYDMIKSQCIVNGMAPITEKDITSLLEKLRAELGTQINQISNLFTKTMNSNSNERAENSCSASKNVASTTNSFCCEYWNGRYRGVPKDYSFPMYDLIIYIEIYFVFSSLSVPAIWNAWCKGIQELGIKPFCKLSGVKDFYKESVNFSRCKRVMEYIFNNGLDGTSIVSASQIVVTDTDCIDMTIYNEEMQNKIFETGFQKLLEFCDVTKTGTAYGTFYNCLLNAKKPQNSNSNSKKRKASSNSSSKRHKTNK